MLARQDLLPAEPVRGNDHLIERRFAFWSLGLSAKGHAQKGQIVGFAIPVVEPENRLRLEPIAGFLAGLADHGLYQCFARLDVAGGLVDDLATTGMLLDEQETASVLD